MILLMGMSYPAARMAATPGRFCDAMVTTNSGSARLTTACQLNTGVVHTGRAHSHCTADQPTRPCAAAIAMPTSSVMGTA